MCPGPQHDKANVLLDSSMVAAAAGAGVNEKEEGVWEFFRSYTEEPHKSRRESIIKAHPEIRKLFGPCPWTKYKVAAIITIQVLAAIILRSAPFPLLLLLTYTLSGSCNHFLTLTMHEVAHNLAFKGLVANRIFSIIANLPLGIPAAISFKRYHMEHHKYQGNEFIDVDLPTDAEGKFFRGGPLKLLFVFLMPAFYSLRPLLVRPKKPSKWEGINILVQMAFDLIVFLLLGWKSLFYLVIGTLLGMGIHPMAGHFIAEHFVYQAGQETYSYYGPLNWLSLNVGYHNEHHDFPNIPGTRLHEVRRIAPEFYMPLPHYYSWTKVIWDFVVDPAVTPFNRVKRNVLSEADKQVLAARD